MLSEAIALDANNVKAKIMNGKNLMSHLCDGITKNLAQATGKSSLYWDWHDKGDRPQKRSLMYLAGNYTDRVNAIAFR